MTQYIHKIKFKNVFTSKAWEQSNGKCTTEKKNPTLRKAITAINGGND